MRRILVCLVLLATVLFSCGNPINNTQKQEAKSKSGKIDNTSYINLTVSGSDARSITREDILGISSGVYLNGDSRITIDVNNSTVELSTNNARYGGDGIDHAFYSKYVFTVLPAGKNCAYIQQASRANLTVNIDGVEYKGNDVKDLLTCIPLYGFGESRIEVSSIMDGYIAMPSGTYWKK
jgi:hypothetical protein